jgi:uncharacterized surface protein with fasciclin (FAS1) repeats
LDYSLVIHKQKPKQKVIVKITQKHCTEATGAGQSGVQDATSNPNIVQVAIGSKDHTTLVAAVKAANWLTH